ncbi:flagellar motor protein MotB [Paenibacillus sp. L3-i20]|uniref:flagellar motor protein MotB n=1 Tax=Paenibacillus sp. L3-i20 TaxID=2905833 RepID=UPI001EDD895A|nr:flagellar motor protein MotB [Paenibacillus sp. L3-i20]GKU76991.1 flagellar motor protein MotB [Paenibacillus sp. L3-i20]
MSKKRRHEEHEEHVDESWLIPYADLLTLLLALFIVLFAMNSVDAKKFEDMSQAFSVALNSGSGVLELPSIVQNGKDPDKKDLNADDKENEENKDKENEKTKDSDAAMKELIKQEQAELEDLKKKIDAYIDKNGLTSELETQLNMSQLLITISDKALFAPAQAVVREDAEKLATEIGAMIQQYPNYDIIVAGHTDDTPINNRAFRSNWDLSSMRAVRFMDVMLENKNLDPKRFSAIGYGEYHPVAENTTKENKAKNRRVEVSILHTYVDATNPQTLKVK